MKPQFDIVGSSSCGTCEWAITLKCSHAFGYLVHQETSAYDIIENRRLLADHIDMIGGEPKDPMTPVSFKKFPQRSPRYSTLRARHFSYLQTGRQRISTGLSGVCAITYQYFRSAVALDVVVSSSCFQKTRPQYASNLGVASTEVHLLD